MLQNINQRNKLESSAFKKYTDSVELSPLQCTLQHQEICLPDDHTPIFDFPLNHDTGII